ncbi:hypothetical protein [Scytonema sp. PCC 10023]
MTQLGNATRLFGGAEYGHKDPSRAVHGQLAQPALRCRRQIFPS